MSTALTTLTGKLAKRLELGDGSSLIETLKLTAFRQRGNDVVTDAQMEALLIVAEQYRLNPFTKELFAFSDKGAIVPVVSVDGWSRIINEHPQSDGFEFTYSESFVTMPRGKPCPDWCEVSLFRKDRSRPTVIREFLDEVYQPPRGQNAYDGPWQSHTKRFLRHKTLIQGARLAFGFAGIYDEDEARRIIDAGAIDSNTGEITPHAAAPVARPSLPNYSQESFDKNLTAWRAVIESGRKTTQALIDMLSTKAVLSDAQKAAIHKLAPIEAEQPTGAAEQEVEDQFVRDMA